MMSVKLQLGLSAYAFYSFFHPSPPGACRSEGTGDGGDSGGSGGGGGGGSRTVSIASSRLRPVGDPLTDMLTQLHKV